MRFTEISLTITRKTCGLVAFAQYTPSALDVETRLSLRLELKRIQREFGTTMVYITHDQEEAFALSDRVMVMGEGSIHQLAAPDEIIANPADDYVADFVVKNLRIKMDSLARFMDR